jgi:hypothetical protein
MGKISKASGMVKLKSALKCALAAVIERDLVSPEFRRPIFQPLGRSRFRHNSLLVKIVR